MHLIDIFTGVTCCSLQNHLRTFVEEIEQDIAMCSQKFPALICRPIAAQFTRDNLIALFDMQQGNDGLRIASEKHYMLCALLTS